MEKSSRVYVAVVSTEDRATKFRARIRRVWRTVASLPRTAVPEIISNETGSPPVFMFESDDLIAQMTEHALASETVLMARTSDETIESAVRQHARLVYRIAYMVLRNHHDAEDATQETFLRVLRYRRELEGVADAKTFLARIAWRVATGRGRKNLDVPFDEYETGSAVFKSRSQLASAEQTAMGNDLSRKLAALIGALPDPLRDAIRLSAIEELSNGEIAVILSTSEASVRSRLFRARQILKQKLSAMEGAYGNAK